MFSPRKYIPPTLTLILLLAGSTIASDLPHEMKDDFESGGLAVFWVPGKYGSGRYEPGRVLINTNLARAGSRSLKITVQEGDIPQKGNDGLDTERAEMDSGKWPLIGHTATYQFSVFIPKDFPIVNTRLVISQIKQNDIPGSGPLIAERFRNGVHSLTLNIAGHKSRQRLPKLTLGQWHDLKFRVRYATNDTGEIDVWMDHKKVVRFRGQTADGGGANAIYHKFGLYRDRMKPPMTAYFDNFIMRVDLTE